MCNIVKMNPSLTENLTKYEVKKTTRSLTFNIVNSKVAIRRAHKMLDINKAKQTIKFLINFHNFQNSSFKEYPSSTVSYFNG